MLFAKPTKQAMHADAHRFHVRRSVYSHEHAIHKCILLSLAVFALIMSGSDDWLVNGGGAFVLIASGPLIVLLFASSNIASTKSAIYVIRKYYRAKKATKQFTQQSF